MQITYTIEDYVREIRVSYHQVFGKYPSVSSACPDTTILDSWLGDLLNSGHGDRERYLELAKMLEGIEMTEFGSLVLFHYIGFDVIYGDMDPEVYWSSYGGLYRTCRSTVIDLETGETVIKPFDKFFNVNELPETAQEVVEELIEKAKFVEISEKLDGSIVYISNRMVSDYSGRHSKVYMGTSKSLNPETSWHLAMGKSMYGKDTAIQKMVSELMDWTFMFEMICSEDAHVVYYPESECGLHLIGARTPDGRLIKYSEILKFAQIYGIKTTQVFNKSFNRVMSELDDKKSDEAEGFVIRIDDQFFKLKYNDYVSMHKVINRLVSGSGIIEAYKNGSIDDLLSKVPFSYREQVTSIVNEIKLAISELNTVCECVSKEARKFSEIRDQMMYIQRNVPRMLQGYCISATKNQPVSIFRGNKCLKLKDIRSLYQSSKHFIESLKPKKMSEYEMCYGGGYDSQPHIATEGDLFNFGNYSSHSEFNSEAFSI